KLTGSCLRCRNLRASAKLARDQDRGHRAARMRAMNWRGTIWAAWLGLLALAVNALVPVHLAFDLAEALGPTPQHPLEDEVGRAERQLLALISGHREADGRADEHG